MTPARGIDQLSSDANAVSRPSHTPFEHISDAQFTTDLRDVYCTALVRKGGVPRDHEEIPDMRQGSNDLFRHSIPEILLLGAATHVGQGQDRYGRLVREGQRF